jgi:hypothetical protein
MAIAGPTTQQGDPELTYRDPNAYIAWLRSKGVPPQQVYQMVTDRFGPPKTREQQQKEQASNQQTANLAQTGGALAGMVGGTYLAGQFGTGATAAGAAGTGTAAAGTGAAAAGGAGASTVATPTLLSATQTGASAGAGGAGSTTLAAYGPYAAPVAAAAGLYGGYKTAEMLGETAAGSQRTQQGALSGAASGAALGSSVDLATGGATLGLGTLIGGVVGGLAGAIGSWTGSSKGKAQFTRDNIRGVLQKGGVLDRNFQGTLADGSTYDFGADGSTLKWKNIDKVAEAQPGAWSGAVPLTDALATAYGFVGQKASDISAWYAKAAVSNANNDPNVAKANARHFAAQQGITYDMIKGKLDEAKADNRINDSQYNYYLQGAQDLVGTAPAGTRQVVPPAKGQVARVSPGMYMNDKGKVVASKDVRSALKKYYGEGKTNAKK